MSQTADDFKHQFTMLLRDTISPQLSSVWNQLVDESSDPATELKALGVWAAEQLKQAADLKSRNG